VPGDETNPGATRAIWSATMKAMFLTLAAALGIAPGTASLTSAAQAATVQPRTYGTFGRG
jgi:hypothetical protein